MHFHAKSFIFLAMTCFISMSGNAVETLEMPITEETSLSSNPVETTVIRGAIDIGSGATKLRVAEVNLITHKIDKILANESYTVNYQEDLENSQNHTFSQTVMDEGIAALKKSKEAAAKLGAEKVVAVATAAFRKASNSEAFLNRIYQETGISVFIIDQDLEAKLAFQATSAKVVVDPFDLIVWDIGGGSLQMTMLDEDGSYFIYRGHQASIPFKNYVVKHIERKNPRTVRTPNPMNVDQIYEANEYARDVAQEVDAYFREKIQNPNTQVVGVGNIFAYGIYPLVGNKEFYNREELAEAIQKLAYKNDEELGGGDYVNVAVTNPILVLGFMQTLDIGRMQILDINNADGALLYPDFWRPAGVPHID